MDIDRDQGIHFTSHAVQEWANKNDIHWYFHLPYDSIAAVLTGGMNGLLKQQLRLETHSQHVDQRLTQAL